MMKFWWNWASYVLLICTFSAGEARVFDFGEENLATHLRVTGGLSNVAKGAFGAASGADTSFTEKVEFNFSGELGVLFILSRVTVKLGVEALVAESMGNVEGKNSSGVTLMSIDSSVLAYLPRVSFELTLFQDQTSRFVAGFGVGYATVKMTNDYSMTDDGTAALGVSNYTEVGTASVMGGSIFGGIEGLFADNITFTAEVGYRYYQFSELSHDQAATTINGDVSEGDPVLNTDGTARDLDFKGMYAGIGFRVYIDFPN